MSSSDDEPLTAAEERRLERQARRVAANVDNVASDGAANLEPSASTDSRYRMLRSTEKRYDRYFAWTRSGPHVNLGVPDTLGEHGDPTTVDPMTPSSPNFLDNFPDAHKD